jgi:hypothetical protein
MKHYTSISLLFAESAERFADEPDQVPNPTLLGNGGWTMRWRSGFLMVVVIAALVSTRCGSSKQALVSITVNPPSGTATHGSANDAVTFKATGNYTAYDTDNRLPNQGLVCAVKVPDSSQPLAAVTWSTSDSINTSVDANGVATCLGPTATSATITAQASGVCGVERGNATLTCN